MTGCQRALNYNCCLLAANVIFLFLMILTQDSPGSSDPDVAQYPPVVCSGIVAAGCPEKIFDGKSGFPSILRGVDYMTGRRWFNEEIAGSNYHVPSKIAHSTRVFFKIYVILSLISCFITRVVKVNMFLDSPPADTSHNPDFIFTGFFHGNPLGGNKT